MIQSEISDLLQPVLVTILPLLMNHSISTAKVIEYHATYA